MNGPRHDDKAHISVSASALARHRPAGREGRETGQAALTGRSVGLLGRRAAGRLGFGGAAARGVCLSSPNGLQVVLPVGRPRLPRSRYFVCDVVIRTLPCDAKQSLTQASSQRVHDAIALVLESSSPGLIARIVCDMQKPTLLESERSSRQRMLLLSWTRLG